MFSSYTGVILSEGANSRLDGVNKAFMRIGEKRIIDRIYDIFCEFFNEIILVTNDPAAYLDWDLKIVTDCYPVGNSLAGIHAGLFYSSNPYAFFTACDMPFMQKKLIETLICAVKPQIDVVIPETSAGVEPLCAIYSKRLVARIENQLEKHEYKIQKMFNKVFVKKISEKDIRATDPELISFLNINTPDLFQKAKEIIQE